MKRWAVLAAILAIGGAAIGIALALTGGDGKAAYVGSAPEGLTLPAFSLHESSGAPLDEKAADGKVAVVTFLESKCRESCPIIGEVIPRALAQLDAKTRDRVIAIGISVHPLDDTPAAVREFLRVHHAETSLHYLIGSEAELRPVWKAFQVASALDSGSADLHSAPVRVYDPRGRWVSTLYAGRDLTPDNLAHDVTAALG